MTTYRRSLVVGKLQEISEMEINKKTILLV